MTRVFLYPPSLILPKSSARDSINAMIDPLNDIFSANILNPIKDVADRGLKVDTRILFTTLLYPLYRRLLLLTGTGKEINETGKWAAEKDGYPQAIFLFK